MSIPEELFLDQYDDELEEEELETEEDRFSASLFREDLKLLRRNYVDAFFGDKRMHCGGSIPKYLLHAENRLSLVGNLSILDAVDMAYRGLENSVDRHLLEKSRKTGESTSDIRLVNETLKKFAKAGIPQEFAGGLLILYLEFCEGVTFSEL
jgi:hypothetical protein